MTEYKAPVLFPEFAQHADYHSRRDYLKTTMELLAEEKSLSLTDIYNQPSPIPDMCGEIILGYMYSDQEDGLGQEHEEVPPALAAYQVTIKAHKHATIEVENLDGTTSKKPWTVRCKLPSRPYTEYVQGMDGKRYARKRLRKMSFDSEKTTATVRAALAWRILRQHGSFCRTAKTIKQQRAVWRCEEVKPKKKPTLSPAPKAIEDVFA